MEKCKACWILVGPQYVTKELTNGYCDSCYKPNRKIEDEFSHLPSKLAYKKRHADKVREAEKLRKRSLKYKVYRREVARKERGFKRRNIRASSYSTNEI